MTQPAPTNNRRLVEWVQQWAETLQPDRMEWCDGSDEHHAELCRRLVASETFIPLDPALHPNSYLCRSDPEDVARVEDRTFIYSERKEDAGPTNNWRDPAEMRHELLGLFRGAMRGRTMYGCHPRIGAGSSAK